MQAAMAPHDILCAAAEKLIATVFWDEKVRMHVFIEFFLQEKCQRCCFHMTTPGQYREGAPLRPSHNFYGGCCRTHVADFHLFGTLECCLQEDHGVNDESWQNALRQWLQFLLDGNAFCSKVERKLLTKL
jgi:hypothetical protein